MDFTPHSRFQSCKRTLKENVGDKISNGGAVAIEANDGSDNNRPFSVLLMPCSLLIFKDDAYSGKFMSKGLCLFFFHKEQRGKRKNKFDNTMLMISRLLAWH